MFSHVDPRSPTPIYAQIADRIRVAVAAGELAPGQDLPSVRSLASRLRVNPATVVQAYRELQREGLVELRQGSGTFVSEVGGATRARERERAARRLVRDMLGEAARLGIGVDEVSAALAIELPEAR
ncbi:MAG: GntR family transcriptional regulator [Gemmatimonadaceae bacterium]|nr:GntR family transcriptional regulator [Gemmatimonadaceae bacterium]